MSPLLNALRKLSNAHSRLIHLPKSQNIVEYPATICNFYLPMHVVRRNKAFGTDAFSRMVALLLSSDGGGYYLVDLHIRFHVGRPRTRWMNMVMLIAMPRP